MIRLRIKETAQARGISQRNLWRYSGVDLRTIQRIYKNPTGMNITLDSLDRLAIALEVDASELIETISQESRPVPGKVKALPASKMMEQAE